MSKGHNQEENKQENPQKGALGVKKDSNDKSHDQGRNPKDEDPSKGTKGKNSV